jgi:hypothetical protein
MEPGASLMRRSPILRSAVPGALLALITEFPTVFDAEVLTKLDLAGHFRLARVNRACRDVVFAQEPIAWLREVEDDEYEQYDGRPLRKLKEIMAAKAGRLAVLQLLCGSGQHGRLTGRARYCAAFAGHTQVFKWLVEHDLLISDFACNGAAGGGRFQLLLYLRANGAVWSEETTSGAAQCGRLDILQYLRANGCPWDASTCRFAAQFGHLHVLQWARANGCPWDKRVFKFAVRGQHRELLGWAVLNGCPLPVGFMDSSSEYEDNDDDDEEEEDSG